MGAFIPTHHVNLYEQGCHVVITGAGWGCHHFDHRWIHERIHIFVWEMVSEGPVTAGETRVLASQQVRCPDVHLPCVLLSAF